MERVKKRGKGSKFGFYFRIMAANNESGTPDTTEEVCLIMIKRWM